MLQGSPREKSNTNALLTPFIQGLEERGHCCQTILLREKDLRLCTACRACQRDWTIFGCVQEDDVQAIIDSVLSCDLLVLASPIYAWYCTFPMKAVLGRLCHQRKTQ
ncbi:flavodoxin family protein [Oscillibacter sp.]|uniref:flavodoxin family protein n=1 Tax=Oscillibacter sp. TaxID=1945593 RepID=UPI0028AE509C|nr:flavodoxin family protein [Oscillibacter sp.]